MLIRALFLAVVALTAGALVASAAAASGKDGRDVLVRGSCSAGSTSKLKLSPENGRIEIEFEVDQNRRGVLWSVTIQARGRRVAALTRRTAGPSGSFTARRVVANGSGRDVIRATARRRGETCTATAVWP